MSQGCNGIISHQTLLFPLHHCDIHELGLELELGEGAMEPLAGAMSRSLNLENASIS